MLIAPVIKWSGSKRNVASNLAALVPPHERYYEPFVGGGAMIPHVRPQTGYIGDIIPELMALWKMIRDRPFELASGYERHWTQLATRGHEYYYLVRDEFNLTRDPVALLFLSRTCVNGLIRFNMAGEFNNSLHHTRPGISPARLAAIIEEWSSRIRGLHMEASDYRETTASARKGDFVFLDPPYVGTRGRYRPDVFDYSALVGELERLTSRGVRWMLTLDGSAGERIYTTEGPRVPAVRQAQVDSGHSPFTRLMKTSLDDVLESVYFNFDASA